MTNNFNNYETSAKKLKREVMSFFALYNSFAQYTYIFYDTVKTCLCSVYT